MHTRTHICTILNFCRNALQSSGKKSVQSSEKHIGFRDAELVRDPLPDGETFYFRVNGDGSTHTHTDSHTTYTHNIMYTHTHTTQHAKTRTHNTHTTHMQHTHHTHTTRNTHAYTHAQTHAHTSLPRPHAGIPVFAKGGNLIPLDAFESRVTSRYLRKVLGAAVIANQNMVRVW